MDISEEQKVTISNWIEEGADLAEIQKRLKQEFNIAITYLEARLLADDLKLALQDPEPSPDPVIKAEPEPDQEADSAEAGAGKVSATIDQVTRPGAMISGRVTFSDGEKGEWFLDNTGRLALNPSTAGYRPSQQDVMDFQAELESLARTQGY